MSRPEDLRWLDAAAALAARGRPLSRPNPAVGAVIVKDGKVVGRGWTQAGGRPHAEAEAIAMASEAANGATLYVTLEPCSMCAGLIVHSRIQRVVYGATEPKAGVAMSRGQFFSQDFLNHRVLVEGGVMAEQCSETLSEFFRMRRLKARGGDAIQASLDG